MHFLSSYLQAEWAGRRSERDGPLAFNKDTIRGFSPRVPAQSNLVDCGIFLLHYVEMFFKVSFSLWHMIYTGEEWVMIEHSRFYVQ